MKLKLVAAIVALFFVVRGLGQADDLMIVEYADWNSGGGLYVEIYNPTCDTINLTDYKIAIYENGSATPFGGTSYPLLGTLAPKATLVIRNRVTSPTSFTSCNKDTVMQLLGLTGNAALVLSKGSSLTNFVDMIGAYGFNLCSVIPGGCASYPEPTPKVDGVAQALYLNRIVRDTNNFIRYTSINGTSANSWPHDTSTNVTGWTVGGPGTCVVKGFNGFPVPKKPVIVGTKNRQVCGGIDSTYSVTPGDSASKLQWIIKSGAGSLINGADSGKTVAVSFSNTPGYDTLILFETTPCSLGGVVLTDTVVIEIKDCAKGCVVINEIMIKPNANNNDTNGFAGEWVELFNTCCDTVDIGCFRLSNGRWGLTIPAGTVLMPFSFYTIGSDSAAEGSPNLNTSTCNCLATAGSSPAYGAYHDSAGQLVFYDTTGKIQDAIIWGGGSGLPASQPAPSLGSCGAKTVNLPANTGSTYQNIGAVALGVSNARSTDGGLVWASKTGSNVSFGNSNDGNLITVKINENLYDTLFACGQQYSLTTAQTGAGQPTWKLKNGGATGTVFTASVGGDTIVVTTGNNAGIDTFVVSKNNPACQPVYDTIFRVLQPCKCTWIVKPLADTSVCVNNTIQLQSTLVANWFFVDSAMLKPLAIATASVLHNYTQKFTDTIVVINQNCPDTVKVTFNPLPIITGLTDTSTCANDSIQINPAISPNCTFKWVPTTGLNDSTLLHPFAKATSTIKYNLYISNTITGCAAADSFVFTVAPLPTIQGLNNTNSCLGDSIQITATISPNSTFKWMPTIGLNDSALLQPKAGPVNTTRYSLHIADTITGCTSADSFLLTINANPTITGLANTAICEGGFVNISPAISPNTSFKWIPTTGLNDSTILTPQALPGTTTQYKLLVTDTNAGCTAVDSFVLTVNPKPVITGLSNKSICLGDSVLLQPVLANTSVVNWLPAAGLSCTNCLAPYAKPLQSATYKLTATSMHNCIDSQLVNVVVNAPANVSAGLGDTICAGQSALLTATGGIKYEWSTGDTTPTVTVQPLTTGYYKVRSIAGGCFGAFDSVLVVVDSKPIAAFTVTPTEGEAPLKVTFSNSSSQGATYVWLIDNNAISTDFEPQHTITDTSTHLITLITINSNGCADTAAFTIKITTEVLISIPNVFTPNGDSLNDYFEGVLAGITSLSGGIYNRWGEELHTFTYPTVRWWDGNYQGVPCPEGVYFCIITYLDAKGEKHNYSGTITLLR
jgi:gliding motility-associated-like protein